MSNPILNLLPVANANIIVLNEHKAENMKNVCRLDTTYTTYSFFNFYFSFNGYIYISLVKYSFIHFSFVHFPFVGKACSFFLTHL